MRYGVLVCVLGAITLCVPAEVGAQSKKEPAAKAQKAKKTIADLKPKIETYLRKTLGNQNIKLTLQSGGSAEIYIGSNLIGVIYPDDDDFEVRMTILEDDLN